LRLAFAAAPPNVNGGCVRGWCSLRAFAAAPLNVNGGW
jgi:hypothetical protein